MQRIVLSIFIFGLFAIQCSYKKEASCIASIERIVEKAIKNQSNYTEDDWDNLDEKFGTLYEEYLENSKNFSKEERKMVAKLKGKYFAIRTKSGMEKMMDNLNTIIEDFGATLEGFNEEFFDNLTDDDDE